jgi:hypothetical protein
MLGDTATNLANFYKFVTPLSPIVLTSTPPCLQEKERPITTSLKPIYKIYAQSEQKSQNNNTHLRKMGLAVLNKLL